ncbi:MAG: hydrogenase maturation nickel metallochaperone HypA [Pirellulales bacterium]|nr:hydrogenase maturation nickel metallochaperone HypA [Pirellulales bacterium]
MHELSIVEALIEQAQKEMDRAGHRGRVLRMELVIGRLAGVSCDSVRFAFDLLAPGTPLEGAQVHIAEPKATCRCHTCDAKLEIDEITIRCPHCGGIELTIEGGRELLLQSIEIED